MTRWTDETVLQWRTCGGRSHDRLQLEFRATRWSLVVPTVAAMREVGLALWEILQELDSHFLEEHALLRRFGQQGKTVLQINAKSHFSANVSTFYNMQVMVHIPQWHPISIQKFHNLIELGWGKKIKNNVTSSRMHQHYQSHGRLLGGILFERKHLSVE